jgi:uncharacterized protein (TIGR02145 family)
MTKRTFFLMLMLIMMSAASVNAQVTIGSTDDPHGGAVLDLSKANGEHAGFLLPRISLENVATWQIGGDKSLGIGMVVYNTNNSVAGGDGIGIYIWEGNAWTRVKISADDVCPHVFRDAEGNSYTVGWFGAAGCWMTQNLRSTYTWQENQKMEPIEGHNKNNNNYAVFYYYPKADPNILTTNPEYGLLYTWGAANIGADAKEDSDAFEGKTSTRQGICPEGWVIPSDYDFNQLEKEIATNPSLYSSQATPVDGGWKTEYETTADWRPSTGNTNLTWWGRQMKSPTPVTDMPNGSSKVDGTGFNALLVGNLGGDGSTGNYGEHTYFWSSSAISATAAWRRTLTRNSFGVDRKGNSKLFSFSVRCKKL